MNLFYAVVEALEGKGVALQPILAETRQAAYGVLRKYYGKRGFVLVEERDRDILPAGLSERPMLVAAWFDAKTGDIGKPVSYLPDFSLGQGILEDEEG